MVYQQILGILIGTNCVPLRADLVLYGYERDIMSDLHNSKCYDLIDIFNDASLYFDIMFTINNPNFSWIKHILRTKQFFFGLKYKSNLDWSSEVILLTN